MKTEHTADHKVFRTRVDASGRIVIPAESNLRKQIKEGDTIVVEEDTSGLRLLTIEAAVREAQEYFLKIIPSDVSLVNELMEERRHEAQRE